MCNIYFLQVYFIKHVNLGTPKNIYTTLSFCLKRFWTRGHLRTWPTIIRQRTIQSYNVWNFPSVFNFQIHLLKFSKLWPWCSSYQSFKLLLIWFHLWVDSHSRLWSEGGFMKPTIFRSTAGSVCTYHRLSQLPLHCCNDYVVLSCVVHRSVIVFQQN